MHPLSAVAAAAILASLTLVSCGGGGGSGSTAVVTPPVLQELQNARYVVTFVDTVTGAPVTDALKVTFVGEAQLKATDGSALNDQTVTTSTGMVFVSADFTSTANDFSVQVSDPANKGWVATGARVVGTANLQGDQTVVVRMVNTKAAAAVNASDAPVAMSVANGNATATGALSAPVAVTTTPKTVVNTEGVSETIGTSSLAISAGTIGKTSSGAAAAPGPLTVSNTYFATSNAESLNAFPGGFAATVEVPAANASVLNGAAADAGTFVTAGFAQFNVTDSQGNAIKTFDKPLTVGIDLPKGTRDENGVVLKVGDQYPVWSYDDTNGKWVFEKLGTIAEKTPVDPNNFTVQFTTTHLSSWNLDQYVNSCTATVNLQGRPANDTRLLTVDVLGSAGQRYGSQALINDSTLTLLRAPNISGTIIVKDRGTEVGRVTNKAFCGAAINVPITLTALPVGNVRIEASESCADGTQQRPVWTSAAVRYTSGGLTTARPAYTRQAAAADKFALATLGSVPSGAVTVQLQNPRTGAWVTTTDITGATSSTVVTGGTTVFKFNFPMTCRVVSGGV
ncbi:hypothetical protein [Ramlibacter alkalitolerans]|uniref:Big-1 domain-containing protein n=1 Tax=Ramlibacter alkalitolerans TaxID=2039631 RepID=A0ABS1JWT0_9BURK|nr:hypothetical protein [Ramlibacter alkalitolerans]MBL0428669.1 hypothetical protein [Ramlibacter alkalitolerans]